MKEYSSLYEIFQNLFNISLNQGTWSSLKRYQLIKQYNDLYFKRESFVNLTQILLLLDYTVYSRDEF